MGRDAVAGGLKAQSAWIQAAWRGAQRDLRLAGGWVAAAMAVALSAPGCTHGRPYVRADVASPSLDAPPARAILQRIILIGDAGAPSVDGEPVLLALRDTANSLPEKTVVVYLGDNIYPSGVPEADAEGRAQAERALQAQLEAAGQARAVFVPGNHDWDQNAPDGLERVRRQAEIVQAHPNALFTPFPGCPGPYALDLTAARVVALDTQWWLRGENAGPACSYADTAAVIAGLVEDALRPPDGRPVVVVAHHPLRSRGPHGGFYTLGEWIFPSLMTNGGWRWVLLPLPGVGPLGRWLVRTDQDFVSRGNTALRRRLGEALATAPPLAYASGHDHGLQVFEGETTASLLLVSGLGSSEKATPVGDEARTLFAHQHPGFMVLDILADRAILRVVEPGTPAVVFRHEVALPQR
ncbi:MAG: metallophosphoesterase [Gemmatimonadota bacterium]